MTDRPLASTDRGHAASNGARRRRWLAAILFLAALLRLINANAELWWDEIVTVMHFVQPPFAQVVTTYGLAGNQVMNSALTNLVGAMLGTDPWMLRLPAIAFGVAGVWAFWCVARQLWPRDSALAGTLLFATSYHHVYYSQNARGYSALIFFGLLSTGLLLRLLSPSSDRERRMDAVWFAVATGLGLYALLLMVFVIAGQALVLLAHRRWRLLAWLAAGCVLALVLYAPMLPSMVEYFGARQSETGYPLLSLAFARALRPILILGVAGGCIMAPVVVRFARRAPVACALLLLPLALNVLAPLIRGQGVYPRSFIFALPVAYLLLVEAIEWARSLRPAIAWGLTALVVLASLALLAPFYQLPKQGFRQALAYIEQHRGPNDDRVGLTLGGKAARFYDERYTLIDDDEQLAQWLRTAQRPSWIVVTFPGDLRARAPRLFAWMQDETSERAEFPGVIGDGTVHVRYRPAPAHP